MYNARQAKKDSVASQKAITRQIRKEQEDRQQRREEARQYARKKLKTTLLKVYKAIQKETNAGRYKTTYTLGAASDEEFNLIYTAKLTELITKELIKGGFKATYNRETRHNLRFYDDGPLEIWIYYHININWT